MPKFEIIPMKEAQLALTLSGSRGTILREYVENVRQLEPGSAGRVTAGEGDTTAAIRRRLTSAAELLDKKLVLNRQGDVVYFWEEGDGPAPVRRRRRRAVSDGDDDSDE